MAIFEQSAVREKILLPLPLPPLFFFFYRGNGFARPNVLKTKNVRACTAIHVSGDSNGRGISATEREIEGI